MTTDKTIAALTIPEQIWLWLRLNMVEIAGAVAVRVIVLLLAGVLSGRVARAPNPLDRIDPTLAIFRSHVL